MAGAPQSGRVRVATTVLALLLAVPAAGQALDRPPDMGGVWTAAPGVVHFSVLHRFRVLDPPSRKVLNTPTLRLAMGLGEGAMVGASYASSSVLVPGQPNEWEAYGRWSPVREPRHGLDGAVRVGWNGTARSLDGEVSLARSVGPIRLHVAGRGFSAWRGGDAATAVAVGAVWRLDRWAALAGDVVQLTGSEADPGWSVGLQLAIPYTPHTLSLHASNVNATTLQSGSMGTPDRRLWGFEFTVPITLARYFGRSGGPGGETAGTQGDRGADSGAGIAGTGGRGAVAGAPGPVPDMVRVTMDNRLRFLPDTVRVQVGGVVVWSNTSDLIHTVTADPAEVMDPGHVSLPPGAATFHSGDIVPDAEYSRRFTIPGVYRYVCVPHEPAGMAGVVIVTEGGG